MFNSIKKTSSVGLRPNDEVVGQYMKVLMICKRLIGVTSHGVA
jgi:hypothetical protein